jgi:hypothetical protein
MIALAMKPPTGFFCSSPARWWEFRIGQITASSVQATT